MPSSLSGFVVLAGKGYCRYFVQNVTTSKQFLYTIPLDFVMF
jgi:hypothetical protein